MCFALLQGTDVTDIQITDGRTFYDVQITEVQMVDYRCTDGCAVKCGGKYALLAKCGLQLYFTDYRWRRHEVWRDGCFACKVASAALLHGITDGRITEVQMAVP